MGNTVAAPTALNMFQNETNDFTINVVDENGAAVDLTGKTLRFVVQDSNNPANAIFKAEGGNIDMAGAATGVIVVTIAAGDVGTATREYHWRLWDVTEAAEPDALMHGTLHIEPALSDV